MTESQSLAYSLSQDDHGWRWCVYDEDGVTVANGENGSRDAAKAAVELTMRRARGDLAA